MRSKRKHGLSTEQFPVSAYVGSSKNQKDLRDLTSSLRQHTALVKGFGDGKHMWFTTWMERIRNQKAAPYPPHPHHLSPDAKVHDT